MPITRRATGSAPRAARPAAAPGWWPKAITTKTSTNVPMISVTRFQP